MMKTWSQYNKLQGIIAINVDNDLFTRELGEGVAFRNQQHHVIHPSDTI